MLLLSRFKDYVYQNSLFTTADKVLLAVSGGRDSVLMAHLFKLSGFDFGIAHCNFSLRGDESQRDEHFVRLLASSLGVPFYVTHFQTKEYAAEHRISTQMAARELRYNWFEELSVAHSYSLVALAQHQDDVIETVLLNLTRGTGIAGLHGILPKRGKLIRPLLFLSRDEINQCIEEGEIAYVEDSSNLSANYARNKIRLRVIPELKEINPNLEHTFEQNIRRFADVEMVLQDVVGKLRQDLMIDQSNGIHLSINKLKMLRPVQLLLFELLRPYGFSEHTVSDLIASFDKQSGTTFYSLDNGYRIVIDREDLILVSLGVSDKQNVLIHHQDHLVEFSGQQLQITYEDIPYFERVQHKAFIDADKLIYPLVVRMRQEGDKFMPLGMKTFKKLSDFLIDQKVPLTEKDGVPLVLNGNGELIWVAGLRQDDRYKVTAMTKKLVVIELKSLNLNLK